MVGEAALPTNFIQKHRLRIYHFTVGDCRDKPVPPANTRGLLDTEDTQSNTGRLARLVARRSIVVVFNLYDKTRVFASLKHVGQYGVGFHVSRE